MYRPYDFYRNIWVHSGFNSVGLLEYSCDCWEGGLLEKCLYSSPFMLQNYKFFFLISFIQFNPPHFVGVINLQTFINVKKNYNKNCCIFIKWAKLFNDGEFIIFYNSFPFRCPNVLGPNVLAIEMQRN